MPSTDGKEFFGSSGLPREGMCSDKRIPPGGAIPLFQISEIRTPQLGNRLTEPT